MEENFIKIISATYKLLDFFPEGDPLKNKAKEKVLAMMERPSADDITILEHYLELAKCQGWLDTVNLLIIKKEWEALKNSMSKKSEPVIVVKDVRQKESAPKNGDSLTDRQGVILKILDGRVNAQVQDIIKEMPNVTKRTIRRDLDDLLKKGQITRVGEFNQIFYQKSDRTHFVS